MAAGDLLHGGHEVGGLVVDRRIRAELAAGVAFLVRPGGHDDLGPEGLGQHDGGGADARTAPVDQQPFPRFQPGHVENIDPDREEGFRQGGRLHHGQPLGDRKSVAFMHGAVLRIAAPVGERADLVAQLPRGDAFAQSHDLARDFKARQVGSAGRRGIAALALGDIGTVDASGGHLDEDLARAGLGQGALLGHQNVGPAGAGNGDGGHGRGQSHGGVPQAFRSLRNTPVARPGQRSLAPMRRGAIIGGEQRENHHGLVRRSGPFRKGAQGPAGP